MKKVLVVAAHPDDEVLGCGGTIARLVKQGCNVSVAILGEGITSRYENRNDAPTVLAEKLHSTASRVARVLGVEDVYQYKLPDNCMDTVPLLEVVKIIEGLIEKVKPEVVYTHHEGDLNIDHVITARAVLTATRPVSGCPVREIYSFEIPSSTEWSFARGSSAFRPNVFIEITDTLKLKIDAMSLYEGEVRPFPHPRSPEALTCIAKRWGSVVGCSSAEAFELIRLIY